MAAMHLTTFYQNSLYLHFVVYLDTLCTVYFWYILCQAVMHALSFPPGNELFCGRFQSGNEPDSFRGWGLLRLVDLLLYEHTAVRSLVLYTQRSRCTEQLETPVIDSTTASAIYTSQASSRMQERARMLMICAVVALYSGFASCRPEDYPFRHCTLPWEGRVMVSYNCVL